MFKREGAAACGRGGRGRREGGREQTERFAFQVGKRPLGSSLCLAAHTRGCLSSRDVLKQPICKYFGRWKDNLLTGSRDTSSGSDRKETLKPSDLMTFKTL